MKTVIVFLLFTLQLRAVDLSDLTWEINNGQVSITDCDSDAVGTLSIPDTIDGLPVTSIGPYAFHDCNRLLKIEIPNGVTSIGREAFVACDTLTEVSIPESVTVIGPGAFSITSNLINLQVAPSNPTFRNNQGILFNDLNGTLIHYPSSRPDKSYTIPQGTVSIGMSAFSSNGSLETIIIPDSVVSFEDSAFASCRSLTSFSISAHVTSIGSGCFRYCSSLENIDVDPSNPVYQSVEGVLFNQLESSLIQYPYGRSDSSYTIPDGTISIGQLAFASCRDLTSISFPASLISIGESAFSSCNGLSSLSLPEGLRSIGGSSFRFCNGLTELSVPAKVTGIGDSAFQYCRLLTSVSLPPSVTSIGHEVFNSCEQLASITVDPSNPVYQSLNGALFHQETNTLIHYPEARPDSSYAIPEGTTSIADSAFESCGNLTDVFIPNGVTSIGNDAFSGCSKLTTVSLPQGLISIGNFAFSSCHALESSSIPDSVVSIGSYAFSGCWALEVISIPGSVTLVGRGAFSSCGSLTSLEVETSNPIYHSIDGVLFDRTTNTLLLYPSGRTEASYGIPEGTIAIADSAFTFCNNLTTLSIPASVTSLEKRALSNNSKLTSINVAGGNSSYRSIEGVLFNQETDALIQYPTARLDTTYIVPSGTTTIEDQAFSGANFLTNVSIPESVTEIGDYAFTSCRRISGCEIPDQVLSIGIYAFAGCENLTDLTLPESLVFLGDGALNQCTNLTSLIIPHRVKYIGISTFYGTGLNSISFDGPAPYSPWHLKATFTGAHETARVWPEHADTFGGEGAIWKERTVAIREATPTDLVPKITSFSVDKTTASISVLGGPNTLYRCLFSPDLTGFSDLPDTPVTIRTNAEGTRSFTTDAPPHQGFFIIEEAP